MSAEQKSVVFCCANARFTVLSENCIRLEYHPARKFVNDPSWFAAERNVIPCKHSFREDANGWTITTPALRLHYRKPGLAFAADNLTAEIVYGDRSVRWAFGMNNPGNLGGTLPTLDAISHPVPLPDGLLSRDGWYCLDDSASHLFTKNWISPRPEGAGTDHYLFAYGLDFKAALRSLTAVAGAVPLPRKCIFGAWYSRWYPYTSADYRQIVGEFNEHGIPLDIMVMDMDWHDRTKATHGFGWAGMTGWTGWSWDRNLIPDPQELLKWYHEQGLQVTLNAHPHDGVRENEDCYERFMKELKADPAQPLPFKAGDKKYLDAYFKIAHGELEKQGVDFWWVDWQQDSIMPEADGIKGMNHLPLLNHGYFRFSERAKSKRGLGFSRWAGWGDQRYPIHFSGDATSNWDMLAFEIYFTATAGNVGCFFWSHDIGGFCGKRDPELYARWVQFGSATAAMRMHSTGDELDRRPWKWGEQVEESIRRSFDLRSRLLPYVYSQARHSCHDSLPLCRPLYLEYPAQEQSYHTAHEFLFGDGFLVAPVITRVGANGKADTSVWLPDGEWVNWFTGKYYGGNQTITVQSDLNTFPIFVRAGYPVSMQPSTLRMTTTPLTHLVIRLYPGTTDQEQSVELYEDDGISQSFKNGKHALTVMNYRQKKGVAKLEIHPANGNYTGFVTNRRVVIELGAHSGVREVKIGGRKIPGRVGNGLVVFELGEYATSSALNVAFSLPR